MAKDPAQQYTTTKEHESLQNIVYFCLVVVAIGFLAIALQYVFTAAAAMQSLSTQVAQQNTKIDNLTSAVDGLINR